MLIDSNSTFINLFSKLCDCIINEHHISVSMLCVNGNMFPLNYSMDLMTNMYSKVYHRRLVIKALKKSNTIKIIVEHKSYSETQLADHDTFTGGSTTGLGGECSGIFKDAE